ncbi:hypothetical protein RND81_14G039600 [Saponaria officinalis]|uniref:DNA-(apurinic or apyrimidinic site) endonuclease n=1 Tax=Saponaria officinalis TaxID=3572 RepID=A0AAW1GQ34_SAPOF
MLQNCILLGFRNPPNFRFVSFSSILFRRRELFAIQVRVMSSGKTDFIDKSSVAVNSLKNENKLAEILSIKNEPGKVESMTVQELRNALRTIGASTQGRKQELVSTLKNILAEENDGKTLLVDDQQSLDERLADENALTKQQPNKRKKKPVNLDIVEVTANIKSVKQSTTTDTSDISGKKRSVKRKVAVEAASIHVDVSQAVDESAHEKEPWAIFAHKKPQKGWVAYNPRIMRPPPLTRDTNSVKLMSWNVNGLRALLKLEGFSALQLAQRENFDILCLQETKLQEKDVESVRDLLEGFENSFWTCSVAKAGYSGTAIVSRIKPLSVRYGLGIPDHDTEGRLVTAEFDSFYLLCVYVPNSGDGLKRLSYRTTEWDPSLSCYIKELEKSKPVILTGDLNCAHQEIDIYNPAGNKRSAGFTIEERESFENNFLSKGFVDTFRKQHPDVVGYTYWGYRHGGRKFNRGWRLDYFLVSESMADRVHDSYILPDVLGSDHCPIGLVLKQ